MEPWHGLDVTVRIAGLGVALIVETLDPMEIRFLAVAEQARVACLRLTMITKSVLGADGALPAGTTLDVFTVPGFRGIGIARLLWPWGMLVCGAERMAFRPLHSPSRTRAGQVYAEAVCGDIPALARGRYVECPDQFDPADALWRGRQHLDLSAERR